MRHPGPWLDSDIHTHVYQGRGLMGWGAGWRRAVRHAEGQAPPSTLCLLMELSLHTSAHRTVGDIAILLHPKCHCGKLIAVFSFSGKRPTKRVC